MANTALEIKSGFAKTAMGNLMLYYLADSPSGAFTASNKLHKVLFTFPNAQGMARTFEFRGQKILN